MEPPGADKGKKRKIGDAADNEEEENEEEKMEKFFAILNSAREVRERIKQQEKTALAITSSQEKVKPSSVWHPTFRPEDFMDVKTSKSKDNTDVDDPVAGLGSGSSCRSKEEDNEKEKDGDGGLNLKLSL